MKARWKPIARHKWVADAVINESYYDDPDDPEINLRRFTAVISGWRNFKIYEGAPYSGWVDDTRMYVELVSDSIAAYGEDVLDTISSTGTLNVFANDQYELQNKIQTTRAAIEGTHGAPNSQLRTVIAQFHPQGLSITIRSLGLDGSAPWQRTVRSWRSAWMLVDKQCWPRQKTEIHERHDGTNRRYGDWFIDYSRSC
jgi:hypothetical protein